MCDITNESNFIAALFVIVKYWKLHIMSKCKRLNKLWCAHTQTPRNQP